jgi:hypothetical protein
VVSHLAWWAHAVGVPDFRGWLAAGNPGFGPARGEVNVMDAIFFA